MMDVEDLVALVRNYNPNCDAELIARAWTYGRAAHEGQVRHSGEPYFTHPVAVAAILTEMRLDDATIITALLHDTIEDTRSTFGEVSELFGVEVAELVDGVTKLTNLELGSAQSKQAENLRKLLLATARDLRVILVKLADRLHNMRTIKAMRPDKQVGKARETMEIYAPLAGRMGMQSMREELEDLSFKVLHPEARHSIIRRFVRLQKDSGNAIPRITADIRSELEEAGIEATVYGRAKRPFSIWRKMEEKQLSFSRLSDIYGFRIITNSESECYRALGLIHRRWRAVPGRFKDYISQPKPNGYRSLHTTVSGHDGMRVEVQIRTRQMHEVAESGVAAHWSYRDGERRTNPFAVDPAKWVAELTHGLSAENHDEFLEHVKLEMYSDQVFCFTPKGEVVALPRGATPIDFAYAIHTRIGHATVGAKIDGIRVPLWTQLKNGQGVEIITATGQRPQPAWLEIAFTGRARAAIRRSLREDDRDRFVRLGRELARLAFEHVGRPLTDKALRTGARLVGADDTLDLLARIGAAEISAQDVIRTLYPELADSTPEIDENHAIIGLAADQSFSRAKCCQALPGERIVGITYRGHGVVVHSIDCPVLERFEDQPERWVDLHWSDGRHPAVYEISLVVTMRNDAGVLGRICTLLGQREANINDLVRLEKKPDFYRFRFDLALRDAAQFHAIESALEAEPDVARTERLRDPDKAPDTS